MGGELGEGACFETLRFVVQATLCKLWPGVINIVMLAVILSIAFLGVASSLAWWSSRQVRDFLDTLSSIQEPAETPPEPPFDDADLWKAIERLGIAVAEGIEHVDRKSKRIDGVIAGAQRRFEAEGYIDPGVEAEAAVLPGVDGGNSEGQRLLVLPEHVEGFKDPWASVPGLTPTE